MTDGTGFLLATEENLAAAADHLRAHDPVLAPVVESAGIATMRPRTDYYESLVSSIVSQQLSVKAADSIERKIMAHYDGAYPSAERLVGEQVETLRSLGLSNAKARYAIDLAGHVVDGRLAFDRIAEQSNQEIVAMLTDVKGIGEWTAHMFLMFCVGRLDVLPVGDLGIKNGVRRLYGLDSQPTEKDLHAHAEQRSWHPYPSVACWYIWHSLDNAPAV